MTIEMYVALIEGYEVIFAKIKHLIGWSVQIGNNNYGEFIDMWEQRDNLNKETPTKEAFSLLEDQARRTIKELNKA